MAKLEKESRHEKNVLKTLKLTETHLKKLQNCSKQANPFQREIFVERYTVSTIDQANN